MPVEAVISECESEISQPHPPGIEGVVALRDVYTQYFPGQGMSMLWECIQCVYSQEFTTESRDEAQHRQLRADFQRQFDETLGKCARELTQDAQANVVASESLRSKYVGLCEKHRASPNSAVLLLLPTTPLTTGKPQDEEVDFSHNILGDYGVRALAPIFEYYPKMTSLSLKGSHLGNKGLRFVTEALSDHPALRSLDLSDNPGLSREAGKFLLRLVGQNPRIRHIELSGTSIEPATITRLVHSVHDRVLC